MAQTMVEITIKYAHPDAQPPIYLAGSFSQGPWHPEEMQFTKQGDDFHFSRSVMVEAGSHHQYKFRLGMGDWWVLDEEAPTATDDLGNRNNVLIAPIREQSPKSGEDPIKRGDPAIPAVVVEKVDDLPRHGDDFGSTATTGQKDAHEMRSNDAEPDEIHIKPDVSAAAIAHTADQVADSAALIDTSTDVSEPVSADEVPTSDERIPVSTTSKEDKAVTQMSDSAVLSDDTKSIRTSMPAMSSTNFAESHSGTATPTHEKAPLFAHEVPAGSQMAGQDSLPNDEIRSHFHVSDKTTNGIHAIQQHENPIFDSGKSDVENFPRDRQAILHHVNSTQTRLEADETDVDLEPPSPLLGQPLTVNEPISTSTSFRQERPTSPALTAYEHLHDLEQSTKDAHVEFPVAADDAVAASTSLDVPEGENTKASEAETNEHLISESGHLLDERSTLSVIDRIPQDPSEVHVPRKELRTAEDDHHGVADILTASDTSTTSGTNDTLKDVIQSNARSIIAAIKDVTPSTISRPVEEGKPFNILQAIWRTVFLDWIGGFLSRLRGGDRRA